MQLVPVTSDPNQTFQTVLELDGRNINLALSFRYNEVASCWIMSVSNPDTNECMLDSVPLLTGDYPGGNILEQYAYLQIGSAVLVPTSQLAADGPNENNLGTDFVLLWGDTL